MNLRGPSRARKAFLLGSLVVIDLEEQPYHFFKYSELRCQQ